MMQFQISEGYELKQLCEHLVTSYISVGFMKAFIYLRYLNVPTKHVGVYLRQFL
jgi:hypothetical protein